MIKNFLRYTLPAAGLLGVFAVPPALARSVESPRTVEAETAVYYEGSGYRKGAVFKLSRPEVAVTKSFYSASKSIVNVRLFLADDKTAAADLIPEWSGMNTVPDQLKALTDCRFVSAVKDAISGLTGNGGQKGQTFAGGGTQICSFNFFVSNSKLDLVLGTLEGESKSNSKPIQIDFEPVTIQTVRDVTIPVPLAGWYADLNAYTAGSNAESLSAAEAWFAMGLTAGRINEVSTRLPELGPIGVSALLTASQREFFSIDGQQRFRLRSRTPSDLGEFGFKKTIVVGEKTYEF